MPSLNNKAVADIAPRMGRPPLGVVKTTIRLPAGVGPRIDALVGENRRADFIRKAVEEKLERDERAAAVRLGRGADEA